MSTKKDITDDTRSQYFENLYRWFSRAIRVGVDISRSNWGEGNISVEQLLWSARPHLQEIFNFSSSAFFSISDQDNSFTMLSCDPEDGRAEIQSEVDCLIDQGMFAWALNQSRAFVTPARGSVRTLILHPVATRSRIRGMFVGIIENDSIDLNEGSLSLLSMIMLNLSAMLESAETYEYVRMQNDNLEKIVAQRTGQLVEARLEAEHASRAKSQFLANMSHEIRTPLTAVIGFAELLRDNHSLDEQQRRQAIDTIVRTGRHLLTVINEILDLSKIESDRMTVEMIPFDPFQTVRDVESLVSVQVCDKGLDFAVDYRFPLPLRINSDPTRLKQILLNLCGNALKFTERGGIRVMVSFDVAQQLLQFAITDTGIGIAADKLPKLFDSFTQADNSITRQYGGTGLGLHICRHLSELLGGSVEACSTPGQGSTFTVMIATGAVADTDLAFSLAEAENRRAGVGQDDAVPDHVLSGKVLLAEDNEDIRNLVRYYLNDPALILDWVGNGEQAVEQALSGHYDVVLMDMQMPVMGGVEATAWLRRAGYAGPVVAMTANATADDRKQFVAAGCDGFLSKPIDRRTLRRVLVGYLAQTRNGRDDKVHGYLEEFAEIRQAFIDGLSERIRNIQIAQSERRWDDLCSMAHQLKGSAGGFGFDVLGKIAAQIEHKVRRLEFDGLDVLAQALAAAARDGGAAQAGMSTGGVGG
ncbi:MAG: response regulator [Gammaproteobacteria bacterium]|nr:response regulator [Gammaproteobacteria bacterium]